MKIECKHRSLTFRSGAYYLQCDDCKKWWVAIRDLKDFQPDEARGISRHSGEQRVKPDSTT